MSVAGVGRRREVAGLSAGVLVLAGVDYVGISADHHQYLLPVRRAADPTFLQNDWFAETTESYHPTFEWLLRIGGSLMGEGAMLALTRVLSLLLITAAVMLLLRAFSSPAWLVALPLLVVRFGAAPTWGTVDLLGVTPLPHYLGLAGASLSLALAVARHRRAALLVSVAAFYFHVSVGVWLGLVLAVVLLSDARRGEVTMRQLLPTAGLALGLLVPLVVWAQQSFVSGQAPSPESFRIFFQLRSPHHYDLASLPWEAHVGFVLHLVAAFAVAAQLGDSGRVLRRIVGSVAAFGAGGWLFLHVLYWPLYLRLFPYRLVPVVALLAATGGSALLIRSGEGLRGRVIGSLACLTVLWVPLEAGDGWLRIAASVLLISPVVLALRHGDGGSTGRWWPRLQVSVTAGAAAVASLALLLAPPVIRGSATSEDQRRVAEAVRQTVPVGGVVVAPPSVSWLRLEAGRATVVDFKSFPIEGAAMEQWRERLQVVTGHPLGLPGPGGSVLRAELDERFDARGLEDHRVAAARYGARYLLVRSRSVAAAEASASGLDTHELPGYVLVRFDV
jgi:hypothetical protein